MTSVAAPPSHRRHRRRLLIGLVVYAAFLGWVVLWPSASAATGVVVHTADGLSDLGVPAGLASGGRVEFALNAAMVVPLTVFAVQLWPRWGWERWTAYAFVGSCAVELFQGLLLPMRSAQFADVVANTLGAGAGAVLGQLFLARSRRNGSSGGPEAYEPD